MTAVGLVLILVGVLGVNLFGSPSRWSYNRADYAFGGALLVGAFLTVAGIVTFLWRAMP